MYDIIQVFVSFLSKLVSCIVGRMGRRPPWAVRGGSPCYSLHYPPTIHVSGTGLVLVLRV